MLKFLFLFLAGSMLYATSQAQLAAFPGAEGFGKYATGGRGGKVVAVTNTNDTGSGSFRWALQQYSGYPLTVVFRVSGIIHLQSEIKISRANLTIAGQTAPGDGICIAGNSIVINGAGAGGPKGNIIVRYMRFRPGAPVYLGATGLNIENTHDVILDHCSISWANEENAAIYDSKFITIQWCISSEGLYNAWHHKGARSYSGVWGGQYTSIHHNLIAHNNSRTIRYNGSRAHDTIALVDSRNNVIYNSGSANSCYGGESIIPGGYSRVNIINNTYKPGPATSSSWKFVRASWSSDPNVGVGQWYLNGNVMVGKPSFTDTNVNGLDLSEIPVANRPTAASDTEFTIPAYAQIAMQTADSSYTLVLERAGAILPKRDSVDIRVTNETKLGIATGTGSYPNGIPANSPYPAYPPSIGNGIIDTIAAVGGYPAYNSTTAPTDTDNDGMPDDWETCKGLNPNDSADGNGISGTGYTNLEDYLNGIICNVGVKDKVGKGSGMSLFPNPATSELTIIHPEAFGKASLTLVSAVTGQKVKTMSVTTYAQRTTLDIHNLVSGSYVVTFEHDGKRLSEKFIKE